MGNQRFAGVLYAASVQVVKLAYIYEGRDTVLNLEIVGLAVAVAESEMYSVSRNRGCTGEDQECFVLAAGVGCIVAPVIRVEEWCPVVKGICPARGWGTHLHWVGGAAAGCVWDHNASRTTAA